MVEILFRELTREEDMEISRLDGYDDGLEEGLRKGRAEGEAAGLERGRTAAILELAKIMKSNGRPIAQIAADTGLIVEEIESL